MEMTIELNPDGTKFREYPKQPIDTSHIVGMIQVWYKDETRNEIIINIDLDSHNLHGTNIIFEYHI